MPAAAAKILRLQRRIAADQKAIARTIRQCRHRFVRIQETNEGLQMERAEIRVKCQHCHAIEYRFFFERCPLCDAELKRIQHMPDLTSYTFTCAGCGFTESQRVWTL